MIVVPPNMLYLRYRSHIIESPDYLFINGLAHDKKKLTPVPGCFFQEDQGMVNASNFQRQINTWRTQPGRSAHEPEAQYVIKDTSNKDIYYMIYSSRNNQVQDYIYKIKRKDNQYFVENILNPDSNFFTGGYNTYPLYANYKYLGQTKYYVIFAQTRCSWNDGYTNYCETTFSFLRINKKDMDVRFCNTISNNYIPFSNTSTGTKYCTTCSVFNIHNDENYMFVYVNASGYTIIVRYNIYANSSVVIYSDIDTRPEKGVLNCSGISIPVYFQGSYCNLIANKTTDGWSLEKLTVDFDTDKVTVEYLENIEIPNLPYKTLSSLGIQNNLATYPIITLHNIDDKYIQITRCDNASINKMYSYRGGYYSHEIFSQNNLHNSVVIKVENDVVSEVCIMPKTKNFHHIYGILYYGTYRMYVFFNDKIEGWYFNPSTETLELIFRKTDGFMQMAFDEHNALYLSDYNGKIYRYDIYTPSEIIAEMEKNTYNYTTSNISTFAKIVCKNMIGNIISYSVQLELDGNAVFDDGSKVKVIKTNADTYLNVPVTVNGPGAIEISAIAIEEV